MTEQCYTYMSPPVLPFEQIFDKAKWLLREEERDWCTRFKTMHISSCDDTFQCIIGCLVKMDENWKRADESYLFEVDVRIRVKGEKRVSFFSAEKYIQDKQHQFEGMQIMRVGAYPQKTTHPDEKTEVGSMEIIEFRCNANQIDTAINEIIADLRMKVVMDAGVLA